MPAGSLAAIDIVRGPGSTLYGSSALGGIVCLRTLDPTDLLRGGKKFSGKIDAGYDSADNGYTARASVAGEAAPGTFWLAQVGGSKGHELDNKGDVGGSGVNRTEPDPQDSNSKNFLGKLQHYFDGGHKLGLTGEYRNTQTDSDMPSDITSSIKSSRAEDEQTWKRVSLEYDYTAPGMAIGWIAPAPALIGKRWIAPSIVIKPAATPRITNVTASITPPPVPEWPGREKLRRHRQPAMGVWR